MIGMGSVFTRRFGKTRTPRADEPDKGGVRHASFGGANDPHTRSGSKRSANRKLVIGILLFLAALIACALYIHRTTVPMDRYEIGPVSDPARWRFTLTDGSELQPEDGKLPTDGTDTVVVCETDLTEDVEDLSLIVVSSKSSDCVFFLDGQLIYSPSGRYRNGGFSEEAFSSASGQFGLPGQAGGKHLTMIVQFKGEENRLSRMPKLTVYPSVINYYSQFTGPAADDAFLVGVYFTVALFLMGLFLIGLWKRKSNPGLILLAFCSLSMAFQCSVSYSYGIISLFNSPSFTWFCSVLPQVAMGWIIWYRLSFKPRLIFLPVAGLPTAAALTLLIVGLNNLNWVNYMQIMTAWILPAVVLIMLIAAAVDAVKENLYLRRFFRYFALSVPAVALGWIVSLLTAGNLAKSLKTAFTSIIVPGATLYYFSKLLCTLLLILCFIQAVLELISGMARQEAEMQAMALTEKCAAENLAIMRQSQEETRRQRHEISHHLVALNEFMSRNEEERAREYIKKLLTEATALPTDTYSENLVINAVAGHYLNMAKAEGVTAKTEIRVNSDPPLEDGELCVVLTNLLENALEACRSAKRDRERFIALEIVSDGEHMLITCENSTDAQVPIGTDGSIPSSKPDASDHGYGIPAVRRIVEKHFGRMSATCADGRFTVKVTV